MKKIIKTNKACPNCHTKFGRRGFALLFTVMISSIILSIALGVSSIAFKEVKFGTSAKEANDAFFAADTGVECALANDKFTSNTFVSSGGSGVVTCLGSNIALSDASYPSFGFVVSGLGSDNDSCAIVTVYKDAASNPPNVITEIISKGYNFGNAACTSASPNRIEREVKVNY